MKMILIKTKIKREITNNKVKEKPTTKATIMIPKSLISLQLTHKKIKISKISLLKMKNINLCNKPIIDSIILGLRVQKYNFVKMNNIDQEVVV